MIDEVGVQLAGVDWSWSLPHMVVEREVRSILAAEWNHPSPVAFWPDVGMNAGRARCCLYNTYLC